LFRSTKPNLEIMGVAISMCVSVILVTLLHLHALRKTIQFNIPIKELFKMISLLVITASISFGFYQIYQVTSQGLIIFLLTICMLLVIYLIILLLMRFITKDELQQLPFIQKWF